MSDLGNQLEDRLRSLGDLSRPSRPALDCDAMHRGAARMKRRSQLIVAIPGVIVVVALAASAVAFRDRAPVVVDSAGTTTTTPSSYTLSDRDRELISFVRTTVDLRRELVSEMFDAASFTAIADSNIVLGPQRAKTDAALAAFRAKVIAVDPGRDLPQVTDALKQMDNRMRQLPVIRTSVDGVQNDAIALIDQYRSTIDDVVGTEVGVVGGINNPALFRGLFSHANVASVSAADAHVGALLLVSAEIGFYATQLRWGDITAASKEGRESPGCGEDPAGAGQRCLSYARAIEANERFGQAEDLFHGYASNEEKQIKRAADVGSFDGLKRTAFEDGQGKNDLTGTAGGTRIDPADFRAAADEHIARLFDAERQMLDLIQ